MKAVVFSLGCKVNQCEGQSMIAELIKRGIEATDKLEFADFYIINTCSVTGEADRKSRQAVARALKLNGSAYIYICGCSSQNNPKAFADKPNVRLVMGTAKSGIIGKILDDMATPCHAGESAVCAPPTEFEESELPMHTKTRSYIKIQDGCNNFCSYCIIPYVRGRSRSRGIQNILNEAQKAAEFTKEIVLTGINVSAFGADNGSDLCSLVSALGAVPVRKRFSSLECTVISDKLLAAMAENGFCDHFHLSLQSGSAGVLRRMNRKYTPEFFLSQAEKIRKVFPRAGITTDVITGFGGESEHEFSETVEFVKAVKFSDMHVFPYSERKGTKACDMPQIDKTERQERALVLIDIAKQMREDFYKSNLNTVAEVYAETQSGELTAGYTSNYIKVYSGVPLGEIRKVKLTNLYKEGVKGEYYEK